MEWPVVKRRLCRRGGLCRLHAVNGGCLCSALNNYDIGLIAPVGDPVLADIRGLEGARRAPFRRKTCEAVVRSLKMKAGGAACRDAGTGRSFPMWTLSRDAKSVTSVHAAGEGAKKSPGNRRGEPILVRLMRLLSPPSMRCESSTGPTAELRPNVHRCGTRAAFS